MQQTSILTCMFPNQLEINVSNYLDWLVAYLENFVWQWIILDARLENRTVLKSITLEPYCFKIHYT